MGRDRRSNVPAIAGRNKETNKTFILDQAKRKTLIETGLLGILKIRIEAKKSKILALAILVTV
ncbi:hypothetical protein VZG28_11265 [Synechococcus elongatus IITB4]|uniref:hypothetical protein n=1 Tax=Synechococcus elongatus TaxID=32046 RepID=UPI0030CECA48